MKTADILHPKPVKLLIVINSLILAGAEVLVADLVPMLESRGIDVTVLPLRRLDGPLETRLHERGTKFIWNSSNQIYSPASIWQLRRKMAEFDVIHAHLFPAQLWVSLARRKDLKKPVLVMTEHNTWNHRRDWKALRRLDLQGYKNYDHILCNSAATRDELLCWLPELKVPISIIENGVNLDQFRNAPPVTRESLGIPREATLLVSVARLQPQKDHATVLRAFARVSASAHFALVGDGELRPFLERLADELNIRERVHFLGRRADVPGILRSADIFVHATHSDGFCLAAVEAMATGLPVVVTNVPGLSDVVADAGLLVAHQSPDEMAQAMTRLIESREKRLEVGRAGQARAQLFDIKRTADAYADLYRRLTAPTSQSASIASR